MGGLAQPGWSLGRMNQPALAPPDFSVSAYECARFCWQTLSQREVWKGSKMTALVGRRNLWLKDKGKMFRMIQGFKLDIYIQLRPIELGGA